MKNLKLGLNITLICLIFIFLGAFAPSFTVQAEAVVVGNGTVLSPYLIQTKDDLEYYRDAINNGAESGKYNTSYFKLTETIELEDEWEPIGTDSNPFRGHFDGNGKAIKGVQITYDVSSPANIGLFGSVTNAEIKNLSVETMAVLEDNNSILSSVKAGAIAGKAVNSAIFNCKVSFNISAERVENSVITDKYLGEVNAGGIVGYGEGTDIYNCSATTQVKISQVGTNVVNSNFGGIAGQMNGGRIYFSYVAPSYSGTDNAVSKISQNGGVLTALIAEDADVEINSSKTTDSKVAFGGIVGYARGASLSIYNTIYSSFISSGTPVKLIYGGIIGRLSINPVDHPNLTYSKYLNVSGGVFLPLSKAVGNSSDVSYTVHSSNLSFSTMPDRSFYEGAWSEDWNFDTIWQDASIISYSSYFFPNLQSFSTYSIRLSRNYTVEYTVGGEYSSGFISLYFVNSMGQPVYGEGENYQTEMNFDAGAEVRIKAEFYSDSENNFNNYYNFNNWVLGDNTIVSANNGSIANGYTATAGSSSESMITFTSSANTQGTYSINIVGKPVSLEVYLMVYGGSGSETNIGSVNQTIGNQVINKTEHFAINVNQYQSGVAVVLEAVNKIDSGYIFYRWMDARSSDITETKKLTLELDNTRESTLTRMYPKVIYDEDQGKLVAQLICYYSNNTSVMTLNISGGGSVTIDSGTPITSETHNENLVNGKSTVLLATPDEGYVFEGWYVENVLMSSDVRYVTSITDAKAVEARFRESVTGAGGGLAGWIIAIIVIGSILLVGAVVLIIIKIKKNSKNDYKKKYRY